MPKPKYSPTMRQFQKQFDTLQLADRVSEMVFHEEFSDKDREFIENAMFFLLATVDASGQPQCSYKGGPRGFVKITSPSEIVFPLYEGNGLFISAGNIAETSNVGLLFIDFENQRRMRVNGIAQMVSGHDIMNNVAAAQQVVQVSVTDIHPNCPRNVHKMQFVETSKYTPKRGNEDVGKAPWGESFKDVLPDNMKPESMK